MEKAFIDATFNGNKEQIEELIQQGAVDINCTDAHGNTALIWACRLGRVELVEYFVSNGADVNCVGNNNWTPLHWTCNNSHIALTEYLLNNGADHTATACNGKKPFDCVKGEADKERFQELADSFNLIFK